MAKIKGLDKVLKDLRKYGDKADKEVSNIIEAVASEIKDDAKEIARAKKVFDTGKLVQGINTEKVDKYHQKIYAREKYSAYMEFGTGGKVNVPNELKDVAIQFKGKGVKQINIQPRPFLYPALLNGRVLLLDELKQVLKELSNE